MRTYEGHLQAQGLKLAVVVSRVNYSITKDLLEGALHTWKQHGAKDCDISVFFVPGSLELPFAINHLAAKKTFSALLALGVVIRGGTSHYDLICRTVTNSLTDISIKYDVPVLQGILTVENLQQAFERSGTKQGNKGASAAQAAIELANWQTTILKSEL